LGAPGPLWALGPAPCPAKKVSAPCNFAPGGFVGRGPGLGAEFWCSDDFRLLGFRSTSRPGNPGKAPLLIGLQAPTHPSPGASRAYQKNAEANGVPIPTRCLKWDRGRKRKSPQQPVLPKFPFKASPAMAIPLELPARRLTFFAAPPRNPPPTKAPEAISSRKMPSRPAPRPIPPPQGNSRMPLPFA